MAFKRLSLSRPFSPLLSSLAVLPFLAASALAQDCREPLRRRPQVQQALDLCEESRAAQLSRSIDDILTDLSRAGYCRLEQGPALPTAKNSLCRDPNGVACRQPQGNLLDSRCRFQFINRADGAATALATQDSCTADAAIERLIGPIMRACAGGVAALIRTCRQQALIRNRDAIRRIQVESVYTPARVARLNAEFGRAKAALKDLIRTSSTIPGSSKSMLIGILDRTRLADPMDSNASAACFLPHPGGRSMGIYFDRTVHVCAGVVANLELMNPYRLVQVLAHEMSHAIDPCTLDRTFEESRTVHRNFPGLAECLRGGRGPHGCEGGILNCTSPEGIRQGCLERVSEGIYPSLDICRSEAARYPDCRWGKKDDELKSGPLNPDGGRQAGAALDQLDESFADFLSAGVVARLLESDGASAQDRTDALAAIASAHARLHGTCHTSNGVDEHPPGFIRTNRIMMSNEAFMRAVGCGTNSNVPSPVPPRCPL